MDAVAVTNGCPRVMGGQNWRPFLPLVEHLLNHNQAVYISCKRGGAKSRLLPLLDEVTARPRPPARCALSGTSGDVRMLERTVG